MAAENYNLRILCACGCGLYVRVWGSKANRYVQGHSPHPTRSIADRFWEKVQKSDGDGCWLWTASAMKKGYGQMSVPGGMARAHRISYELHYGPIPDGMFVCHTCDNPRCVNPAHLWLGTNSDNLHDAIRKGKFQTAKRKAGPKKSWVTARARYGPSGRPPGDRAGTKLKAAQVIEIIAEFKAGMRPQRIAAKYGVSGGAIDGILYGRNWRHITGGRVGR